MNKLLRFCVYIFAAQLLITACVSKKRKNETSKVGKFYHNTTAFYNGYWNANEIMKESMVLLRQANIDNYNEILEVEDFVSPANPKMVANDMDKIIDKVSTVAALHEPSDWIDDCYVMMAKAQYVKQDYETAEETLLYFQEDFNPNNPYGRNYVKKKLSKEATKRQREEEKKEKAKIAEALKKEKAAEKIRVAKEREEDKKEKQKEKKAAQKEKEKQRKQQQKKSKGKTRTTRAKTTKEEPKKENEVVPEIPKSEPVKVISSTPVKTIEEKEPPVPVKKKVPEDKTAYTEGMIWLAKTHIKRKNWYSAETVLRQIDSKENLPESLSAEMASTYANLYVKQKNYDKAIPKLLEAIEKEGNRQRKSRYHYIIAQIYQQNQSFDSALNHYELSKKYSKDFKMEFMATMAIAKTGLLTGKKSKDAIINDLEKLLKESKNEEVKYQIYYTMGELELADNNTDLALKYFRLSNANNSSDIKLKTEIYYSIANLFYGKEKYLDAKLYYDSTLFVMPQTDGRYASVKKYVNNLIDIATNIEIINYQDTLLYIADLTGDEQKKAMARAMERNKNQSSLIPANKQDLTKPSNVKSNVNFGNSNFFAYNLTAKPKGKEEFIKIWGNISLEDNWRKNRKTSYYQKDSDVVDGSKEEDSVKETSFSQEEYAVFMKELPSNPIKKKEANDKIITAMFTLGKLFRDKIQNYTKSAGTLEGMHQRFGPTPHELDSYYYLYLDYLDLENPAKANEYKNNIIKKYPDSKYAGILSDPNYLANNKSEGDKLEDYYKETYSLFERGEYAVAASRVEQAGTLFGVENKYIPKFALLGAMCMGSKEGKEAYIKALSDVIISFPNTPEQVKAREIMRFLGGDNDAFKTVQIEDVDKIYAKEDDKVHYVAVITYGLTEAENVNVKVSISEYNKKYFKLERLQLGDASLSREDNSQVILVRKFENATKAMDYYKKVQSNKDEYVTERNVNYDVLPISQANYRKMLSEQSASGYRIFFDKNYLEAK
ncbi:MAG: hypothetical protein IPM42_09050 [Saprospiraceae bacterium]|nr:hypothetical protein [Saprospiraceae bacterium]